jgi:hypothetical protein
LLHRATGKAGLLPKTFIQSPPYNGSAGLRVVMMCNEHALHRNRETMLGIEVLICAAIHPGDVQRNHAPDDT